MPTQSQYKKVTREEILKDESPKVNVSRMGRALEFVLKESKPKDVTDILNRFDEFGYTHEFCMNLGDVKGKIVDTKIASLPNLPKVIVELGGYMGYSALRLSQHLDASSGHLYSIEIDPTSIQTMNQIISHAGLENKITPLKGSLAQVLNQLKGHLNGQKIDLLFIDHVKTEYLNDLKLVLDNELLDSGSLVVADNVITPGAPDYLAFMMGNSHFESDLVHTELEYSKGDIQDAILFSTRI